MGTKLLLFVVLVAFSAIPVFADDTWMVAATDKGQYSTGESMEVSGYILDRKMPVIAMSVYDPDGIILSANSVELQADDGFSKIVSLDSPFYDKSGIYTIEFDYGQNSDQLSFEIIGTSQEEESPIPQTIPEVLAVTTDKKSYTDGEFITVSGMVSAVGDPTILIGIYDKNGFPAGFYTPQITSDLSFSVSFLAKSGINFKIPGTYLIKAHYGESKQTGSFEFADLPKPKISPTNSQKKDTSNLPNQQPKIIQQPQTPKQENKQPTQTMDSKPQQNSQPIPEKREIEYENEKQDNLSVEDQELGKMLNEITLNCDYSEYADSIVYHDAMGPALMRLCNYEQAISYFDKSLIKEPDSVGVITNKATAYSKLGKLDLAIGYYDEALKIEPNYIPALNNKANALAQLGKFEDAILIYNVILDEDPTHATSQDNLQKARENFVQYVKTKQKDQEITISAPLVQIDDTKFGNSNIDYDAQTKPKNFIDQIGNVFASFFGFLS